MAGGARRAARRRPDGRRLWRALSSVRLRAALGLGVVLSIGVTGTLAAWTDASTVNGTAISSGTINLQVNGADAVTGYTSLNITNMVPGNSVAGLLTVTNVGSAPFKYTATSSGTNPDGKNLVSGLVVKVTADTSTSGSGLFKTCAGAAVAGTGTTVPGSLITTSQLLLPAGSKTFCIQLTLSSSASTALQGGTAEIGFTFQATSDLA